MSQARDNNDLALYLLAAVVFIAVINGTMINVALPYIGRDFGVSEGTYGWLVTGYSLTFGIFNAINGRLADLWGKKRVYLAGLVALGGCSLAVAVAPTIELAIAIRLFQGAGAAALPVLGTTIIKQIVDERDQGKAVGLILSVVGVGASIGPFLGGLIVQFFHWRVVFLVTGAALFAIPLAQRLLPDALDERNDQPFDLVGAVLLGSGVASLLYGFNALESWVHGHTTAFALAGWIGGGATLLAAFGLWITRAKEPFLAPHILRLPGYVSSCVLGAASNAGRFGSVVVAPIMLTEINELDPLMIGAVLFPGAVLIATLSSRVGGWADRHGPRGPVGLGLVSMSVGGVVTAWFAGGSPWGACVGLTLYGLGYALAQSPLVSTVNRIVPRSEAGAGVGMFMMIFFVGGAAGVAACVTVSEIQAPGVASLGGFVPAPGGRFANVLLMLTAMTTLPLPLLAGLPGAPAQRDGS